MLCSLKRGCILLTSGGGGGVTIVLCTERLISKKGGHYFQVYLENTPKGKSVLKGVAMVLGMEPSGVGHIQSHPNIATTGRTDTLNYPVLYGESSPSQTSDKACNSDKPSS